jgi:hypothetical protein
VWSVDLTVSPNTPVAGTLSIGTGQQAPGDAAVWVRWKTTRLNSEGKAIYLRKYYHPAFFQPATVDLVMAAWTTAATAFGTKLRDDSLLGSRHLVAAGHSGDPAPTSSGSSTYVTTRTLKRRGKRPNS